MIVIGALQQTPEERLNADNLEVLPAHLGSPHRPRDAVGFQAKVLKLVNGYSRKHRVAIAHIAHFRMRDKGAGVFRLKRHHLLGVRQIK